MFYKWQKIKAQEKPRGSKEILVDENGR